MESLPRQKDGAILQAIGDETVVYLPARDQAFHLNTAVSLVFSKCDGSTAPSTVAEALEARWGQGEELLSAALEELVESGLVELTGPLSTRRSFLGKAAVAIATIAISQPAAASSCVVGNAGCASGGCGCPCQANASAACTRICARRYRRRPALDGTTNPCLAEQLPGTSGSLRCRSTNRYHPNCATARALFGFVGNRRYKCCSCP